MDWRPDSEAMSCKEMIKHVLEAECLYHQILLKHMNEPSEESANPKGVVNTGEEITDQTAENDVWV